MGLISLPSRSTDAHKAWPCGHPMAMASAEATVVTGTPPRATRTSAGRMGVDPVEAGPVEVTRVTVAPQPSIAAPGLCLPGLWLPIAIAPSSPVAAPSCPPVGPGE